MFSQLLLNSMGGILSGISGYFSKHLILGTFLPVVIFVILSWILVVPALPSDWPILRPIESLDPQWKILVISFLTIVLTGLLYNVNIPLISLYEGYPWKELWVGRSRTKKYKKLFTIFQAQWNGLPYIEYELFTAGDPRLSGIEKIKSLAGSKLFSDFPGREDLILPTRLGNVIRSFESYSLRQYGMDAVAFWPRLVASISKDYAPTIDDAKTSFDFMLNCSALSGLLSLMILLTGLLYPSRFNLAGMLLVWLSEVVILYVAAHFFYLLSIGRARAWGNTVRSGFDLYRGDLLKHFGYTQIPESLEEERKVWSNIGLRMVYGDHARLPQMAFLSKETFVECKPDIARFQILRGLTPKDSAGDVGLATSSGNLIITIAIRNIGKYNALELSVTDTLPHDFVYGWGSAGVVNPDDPEHAVTVTGANPYSFNVGKLNRGNELVLKYHALPFRQPTSATNDEHKSKSSLLLFNGDIVAYKRTTETTHEDSSKK